jgi:hypothetical protein
VGSRKGHPGEVLLGLHGQFHHEEGGRHQVARRGGRCP